MPFQPMSSNYSPALDTTLLLALNHIAKVFSLTGRYLIFSSELDPSPSSRKSAVDAPQLAHSVLILDRSSSRYRQSSFSSKLSLISSCCFSSSCRSLFWYDWTSDLMTDAVYFPNRFHSLANFRPFWRSSSKKQQRSRNSWLSSIKRALASFKARNSAIKLYRQKRKKRKDVTKNPGVNNIQPTNN